MNDTSKRLGRGLDSLLPRAKKSSDSFAKSAPTGAYQEVPLQNIYPTKGQPRTTFDQSKIAELAQSIKSVGILEPLVVSRRPEGGFQIIAGERRFRAASKVGLSHLPVIIKDLSPANRYLASLIENLQREDLNAVEVARGYERMIQEFKKTQEWVAEQVGKDRSSVTNALRLLKLPASVLRLVEENKLSEGHGRALLAAGTTGKIEDLAKQALKFSWNVRQIEQAVRGTPKDSSAKSTAGKKSPNVRDLESRLQRKLGVKVNIDDKKGKGKLVISYTSLDELDKCIKALMS